MGTSTRRPLAVLLPARLEHFDTNATCPACGKTHQTTQCLSCARKSPHCDWYHQFGEDPVEVAEEVLVETEADQ